MVPAPLLRDPRPRRSRRKLEVIVIAAVALQNANTFEQQAPLPSRGEVLARYRRLREISKQHHSNVMDFLSKDAIVHHARRLGLADGKTLRKPVASGHG